MYNYLPYLIHPQLGHVTQSKTQRVSGSDSEPLKKCRPVVSGLRYLRYLGSPKSIFILKAYPFVIVHARSTPSTLVTSSRVRVSRVSNALGVMYGIMHTTMRVDGRIFTLSHLILVPSSSV